MFLTPGLRAGTLPPTDECTVHSYLSVGIIVNGRKMNVRLFLGAVIVCSIGLVINTEVGNEKVGDDDDIEGTFVDFYEDALEDYSDENYEGCLTNIQTALKLYETQLQERAKCRIRCKYKEHTRFNNNNVDLLIYDVILARSKCMQECREEKLSPSMDILIEVDLEVSEAFRTLLPLDYLQICAYKVSRLNLKQNIFLTYILNV